MKTQIIRLDRHDDVVSARDKITWGKSARILLVWPKRGRLLTRKLDLQLLQRYTASIGGQLGLVTDDREVRANARELGIPAFTSLSQAQQERWWRERRRAAGLPVREDGPRPDLRAWAAEVRPPAPRWLSGFWARAGFFTLGVLAVLTLAAFLLPSAEVRLTPAAKPQVIRLDVAAGEDVHKLELSGNLPARVASVIVEGQDELVTTGSMLVPSQPASGRVTFTNLTDRALEVPAGTIVLPAGGPPVRFATATAVQVAAGPGQTAEAAVSALQAGTAGNLAAGALNAIEGPLGLSLSVTNPLALTGGSDRSSPAPGASDRELLRKRLTDSLRRTALAELEAGITPGDWLLDETLALKEVLVETETPGANQPADRITLSLRLEYSALVASGADLRTLAGLALDASLPQGYHPLDGSLEIKPAGPVRADGQGRYHGQVIATRTIAPAVDEAATLQLVVGIPPQEAAARLARAFPLDGAPQIRLVPGWWPRMPFLALRVELITQ